MSDCIIYYNDSYVLCYYSYELDIIRYKRRQAMFQELILPLMAFVGMLMIPWVFLLVMGLALHLIDKVKRR